jgi:ABC-type nickel/cobalt efflux system permease component RcnA
MNAKEVWRRARSGERLVLRMQRRWWLAQLALWPTAILVAILVSVAAWALWRHKSAERHSETAPSQQRDTSDVIRVQG